MSDTEHKEVNPVGRPPHIIPHIDTTPEESGGNGSPCSTDRRRVTPNE